MWTPTETQELVSATIKAKGDRKIQQFVKRLEVLEPEEVPIGSIRPNTWNPNRHTERDFELLVMSIREDGFTLPVLITTDNVIIDGEHRWRACQTLGYDKIWIVRSPMSEDQAKLSTIRHNTARGKHDHTLEDAVLRDLQQMGALDLATNSLLMSDEQINERLSDVPIPDTLAGDKYSAAWVLSMTAPDEAVAILAGEQGAAGRTIADSRGDPLDVAMSPKSIVAQADILRRQMSAPTEVERADVQKEARKKIARILLTFRGEDATVVRAALGPEPAVRLYEICVEEWPKMFPDKPIPVDEDEDEASASAAE